MAKWSKRSKENIDECHKDIQTILTAAIAFGIDITITEGHRSRARQNRLYREGKSLVQYPQSKHNSIPSMAFDFIPHPFEGWNEKGIRDALLNAGKLIMLSEILFDSGNISHVLRSGADWDRDGLVSDTKFLDVWHMELIKP